MSTQNVTKQQVIAELNKEEANYHEAAKLDQTLYLFSIFLSRVKTSYWLQRLHIWLA